MPSTKEQPPSKIIHTSSGSKPIGPLSKIYSEARKHVNAAIRELEKHQESIVERGHLEAALNVIDWKMRSMFGLRDEPPQGNQLQESPTIHGNRHTVISDETIRSIRAAEFKKDEDT
jgi:hypothetical protein